MSKYSLSFKLEVVQYYLSGLVGLKATAKHFGIDLSAVRKWTAAWELHGEAGLTTRHFTYSPALKESVILPMREHRLSIREVCAKFTIPAFSTVSQWQRLYDDGGLESLTDSRRRKKRCQNVLKIIQPHLCKLLVPQMNERSLNNCVPKWHI